MLTMSMQVLKPVARTHSFTELAVRKFVSDEDRLGEGICTYVIGVDARSVSTRTIRQIPNHV
jgi:hypothetical protein